MTTTKTIKSIKSDYAAKIRALRAERDEAISEARAARAEKRAQALSMPLLNGGEAVSETIAERAKRVYSEVEELCVELSAKTLAGEAEAVEQLRSIHGDDLVDEAASVGEMFLGTRYLGYTEEDAIAEAYVFAILCSSWCGTIFDFGEYQPKLDLEENRNEMGLNHPIIFGWETESLNNYLVHYFDKWE
ncbi:hypothetical protein PL222_00735 [Salmonella enterica]|uniref:hypothetical protein n=1 Tax=Salmonella enterica TaxID=28901 RepID=UPI0026DB592E|nr:hypothetical protein [Salmonella enterica]MDO3814223.1 hypothetical protein [Salmonella enterica]MDO3823277.1 hypothetical protein [Salmonella enterica]